MAEYYWSVNSGVAGALGTSKPLANSSLFNGVDGIYDLYTIAKDDVIYGDSTNNELSTSTVNVYILGAATGRATLLSINWISDTVEPGAKFFTNQRLLLGLNLDIYGVEVSSSNNVSSFADASVRMLDGSTLRTTGSWKSITLGSNSGYQYKEFKNCTIAMANGGELDSGSFSRQRYENVLFPTIGTSTLDCIFQATGRNVDIDVLSCNLSTLPLVKPIFSLSAVEVGNFNITGCIVASGASFYDSITMPDVIFETNGCDDGTGNLIYRYLRGMYSGDVTNDDTVYRVGGGGYGDQGSPVPLSYKMTSNAENRWSDPLKTAWMPGFIATTGQKTFTVHILRDSLIASTDADVWVEIVSFPDTAGTLMSPSTSRSIDLLVSGTSNQVSAESWVMPGISNPFEQELSVTVNINRTGWYAGRICFAGTNETVYVDKMFVVS